MAPGDRADACVAHDRLVEVQQALCADPTTDVPEAYTHPAHGTSAAGYWVTGRKHAPTSPANTFFPLVSTCSNTGASSASMVVRSSW